MSAILPLQNHHLKKKLQNFLLLHQSTQETEKNAVLSGYWPLYRFDPTKENQPLTIDPPFKNADYKSFTDLQSRYFILAKKDPQKAEELIHEADLYRQARLNEIKKLND